MPSGQQHRKLTAATVPLVVLGAWAIADFPLWDAIWFDIGIIAFGYLINPSALSPDMDLVHSDPSDSYGSFEPLWFLYQGIIHRKGLGRNPLSHWPPLSSILRVFYLWVVLFVAGLFSIGILDLVWYGLFDEIPVSVDLITEFFSYWLLIFTFPQFWQFVWGVALGDLVHLVADVSYSFMRK